MKKALKIVLVLGLMVTAFMGGFYSAKREASQSLAEEVISNLDLTSEKGVELPLEKYALDKLSYEQATESAIVLERVLADEEKYWTVIFSFWPEGRKMSGAMNIPKEGEVAGTIVMLRGWAPLNNYQSGTGTKNAAAYYAREGNFLTVAPDFFGYGDSDPEPEDTWQARFEKPLLVMDLFKSLEMGEIRCAEVETSNLKPGSLEEAFGEVCRSANLQKIKTPLEKMAMWGHSNGGQIALSVLETMQRPIPTTLWAAVTAPFPYSIIFFSDENDDEGKAMRRWLSIFERDYDVFDFTITKNLALIAPETEILLHHGTADEAALIAWAEEFTIKMEEENKGRSAKQKFDFTLFKYPGADHNLRPGWDKVVERDLDFFKQVFATQLDLHL